MAFTFEYANPYLVGTTALQIGQGERADRNEEMALKQQAAALAEAQFAEQQSQNDFRQQLAGAQFEADQFNRDRAFDYGAFSDQQQMALRQQAIAAENAQRAAYNQSRLQEAGMQLQGQREQRQMLAARDQMQILSQIERDRMQQVYKQAAADWEAIQQAAANGDFISADHYASAQDEWQNKYGSLGTPMPVGLPMQEQAADPMAAFIAKLAGVDIEDIPVDENGQLAMDPKEMVPFLQFKQQREIALDNNDTKLEIKRLDEERAADKQQAQDLAKVQAEVSKVIAQAFDAKSKRASIMFEQKKTEDGGKTQGYSPGKSWEEALAQYPPPLVTDPQVYALLPKGTVYRAPNGEVREKK